MTRHHDVLPALQRQSSADILPVLGRPSLDCPVGFEPAGTAIHGRPLHLTGRFAGNKGKSHAPFVGQTTLPMFDHRLGESFKLPELKRLSDSSETRRVFAGTGLDWGNAYPPPASTDTSAVGLFNRESEIESRSLRSGSWLANQKHWLGDNGPSQITQDWARITQEAADNGCYRGTATLKPVEYDPVYEHGYQMVRWGYSLGMEHSRHVYYGQCSLQEWGDSLPMFGGR